MVRVAVRSHVNRSLSDPTRQQSSFSLSWNKIENGDVRTNIIGAQIKVRTKAARVVAVVDGSASPHCVHIGRQYIVGRINILSVCSFISVGEFKHGSATDDKTHFRR